MKIDRFELSLCLSAITILFYLVILEPQTFSDVAWFVGCIATLIMGSASIAFAVENQ